MFLRTISVVCAVIAALVTSTAVRANPHTALGFYVTSMDARTWDGSRAQRPPPVLTSSDILEARVVVDDQSARSAVVVTLSPTGSRKLLAFTTSHLGTELAFLLDGETLSTQVIDVPVKGQTLEIVADDASACDRIARRIEQLLRETIS
jgi:preprotein translocase subunit SecD